MSNKAITWAYARETLKAGPKFVLVTLADLADQEHSCYPGVDSLARSTGFSPAAVKNHLAALTEAGHIRTERRHYRDGSRNSNRYYLAVEHAGGRFADTPETQEPESGPRPVIQSPDSDEPMSRIHPPQEPESGPSLKEYPLEEPLGDPSDTTGASFELELPIIPETEPDTAVAVVEPDPFDAFWHTWPRKVAKPAAIRAWAKAVPKLVDAETVIRAAHQFAIWLEATGRPADKIPHPASWLHDQRWADELSPIHPGQPPGGRRLTPIEQALTEFEARYGRTPEDDHRERNRAPLAPDRDPRPQVSHHP